MKKIVFLLLAIAMLTALFACSQTDHETAMSEVASLNAEKNEVRSEFLNSEVCKKAKKYLEDTLQELIPGCEYQISIEPGKLSGQSLEKYSDFDDNEQIRIEFYSKASVSFVVNFWDFNMDGKDVAKALVKRQISGRMSAAETGEDCYWLTAPTKDFYYVRAEAK